MTEKPSITDKIIDNRMLLAAVRVVQIVSVPVVGAILSFVINQAAALGEVTDRVLTIETRLTIRAADNEKFQAETKNGIISIQTTLSQLVAATAAINARLDTQDRFADREAKKLGDISP